VLQKGAGRLELALTPRQSVNIVDPLEESGTDLAEAPDVCPRSSSNATDSTIECDKEPKTPELIERPIG